MISINEAPEAYVEKGADIDARDFSVTIKANGQTYSDIKLDNSMLTVYGLKDGYKLDTDSVGKKTVTITYDTALVKFSYTVADFLVHDSSEFATAMNSVQGFIVLMNDISVEIVEKDGLIIPSSHTKVFELNGHTISFTTDLAKSTALIYNRGTLTIQDSTDVKKNGTGTGKIFGSATKPDLSTIPGYASNTITNFGNLTINSGLVENSTLSGASYVVDSYANGDASVESIFTMNGGKLVSYSGDAAVRVWAYSATRMTTFIMNGGVVVGDHTGDAVIWLQNDNLATARKAAIELNGGTVINNGGAGVFDIGQTSSKFENITVKFNGTRFEGGEGYFRINNSTFDIVESKINVTVASSYTKTERTENGRLYWILVK